MRNWWSAALVVVAVGASAQTHKVEKAETVVRAVGVYEWTGELGKPAASRLVPVSVYINRHLEDAGVYLARPVPFALGQGTVFELQKAGTQQGTLELAFARHLQTTEKAGMDDGWFAYGPVKPRPAEPAVPAKKSGPLAQVVVTGGSHPSLSTARADEGGKGSVDRSSAAGNGTTVSAGKADSDGRKKDDDSDYAKDDPERPTLKKRTPAQTKARDKKNDTASISGNGDLNDDPDRPNLHRGKPVTRLEDEDLPPLRGVPEGMKQMVAVSDAHDRPEHDFTRGWDSPEEREQVLGEMRVRAGKAVAGYDGRTQVSEARPGAPRTVAGRKSARRAAPVAVAAPASAFDAKTEELKSYTLSYGGAATYVYEAQTMGAVPRFVTMVAQREPDGSIKTAMQVVTDAAHLDRTPRALLVDVVDPDASNRASLLLELRGASSREFALYRVIGASAEQTLVSGPPAQ